MREIHPLSPMTTEGRQAIRARLVDLQIKLGHDLKDREDSLQDLAELSNTMEECLEAIEYLENIEIPPEHPQGMTPDDEDVPPGERYC